MRKTRAWMRDERAPSQSDASSLPHVRRRLVSRPWWRSGNDGTEADEGRLMVQSAPAAPLDRHYLGLGSFALSLSTSHYNHNATTPSSIASTASTSTASTLREAASAMTLLQSDDESLTLCVLDPCHSCLALFRRMHLLRATGRHFLFLLRYWYRRRRRHLLLHHHLLLQLQQQLRRTQLYQSCHLPLPTL